MMSVPFVHFTCAEFRIVGILGWVVNILNFCKIQVQSTGDLSGPVCNNLVVADVLSSKDLLLVVEAILQVLRENAFFWSIVALIEEIRNQKVRNPHSKVIR